MFLEISQIEYRISTNSFLPWIVAPFNSFRGNYSIYAVKNCHNAETTIWKFPDFPLSKKNSFRGNYSRKYGRWKKVKNTKTNGICIIVEAYKCKLKFQETIRSTFYFRVHNNCIYILITVIIYTMLSIAACASSGNS